MIVVLWQRGGGEKEIDIDCQKVIIHSKFMARDSTKKAEKIYIAAPVLNYRGLMTFDFLYSETRGT